MAAGHDSATLDKGTGGDVGVGLWGMLLSPLQARASFFSSCRQSTWTSAASLAGAVIWLPQMHGYYSAADYKGLLIIIKHDPPTHLVAMVL